MKRHHGLVRVTHWINAVALLLMTGSGLRILNAYPQFRRPGGTFCCFPLDSAEIPEVLTLGGWLGGARHLHFAAMWLLVVNGLVYLTFIALHGEWRDLLPRRGVVSDCWQMLRFYTWRRANHPRQGKHNALQRLAYFSAPFLALISVASGLALWKPVSLSFVAMAFGGYAMARFWHFLAMLAIVGFVVGHVIMVLTVDPYALRAMITGGYDPARSTEARNARPFSYLKRERQVVAPPENPHVSQ